jgi:carbonic anhydrase/acetyltransferase-like protein (isoleucine patch superfamily)
LFASDNPEATPFKRHDMGITPFWQEASPSDKASQRAWQEHLATRGAVDLGAEVFVSELAVVFAERLSLGDRTYVSAHSYLWGDVQVGADCTLNPFTEVRGVVRIGDGVRIGAHTSILGFNHSTSTEEPIHAQPLVFAGIDIGDDVWIGSHVVILDGVTIGSHCIIGAGSVVTKDMPDWSVVVGNPARRVRDRRTGAGDETTAALRRISDNARRDVPAIIEKAWVSGGEPSFVDHDGADPTVRAWCDAVELAHAFEPPLALPVTQQRIVSELRSRQDPSTGLTPDWNETDASPSPDGHAAVNYNVLAAGYALELLDSQFEQPIHWAEHLSAREIVTALDALPWNTMAWPAGSWVDSLGTAMHWNRKDFALSTEIEAVFGWLVSRCDPATGVWGQRHPTSGWLEPVNGFYRLTRGTFAQFGVPLPYPERTIDTVLSHSADARYFTERKGVACNVLDVIHPLWLAGQQTSYRRAEGEDWARRQLQRVARLWSDGAGFSFALERGEGWQRTPGLLGTEMWLSITWLLGDYLGMSDVLDFQPQGIHRPRPAASLRETALP